MKKPAKYKLTVLIKVSDGRKSITRSGWLLADEAAEMFLGMSEDLRTEDWLGWQAFISAWHSASVKAGERALKDFEEGPGLVIPAKKKRKKI